MNQCKLDYDESLGGWVIRDTVINELLCLCKSEEIAIVICEEIKGHVF